MNENNGTAPSLKAPQKLKLLVVVSDAKKGDFFLDLIQGFDVNLALSFSAKGTASSEIQGMLGLSPDKTATFAVLREDRCPELLDILNNRFTTLRGCKGIAFTVPLTGVMGVALYRFLSNDSTEERYEF